MEDLQAQRLTRAIGVSNFFYPDRLIDLIDHNEVTPAVNQIETHPFSQRVADQDLMRARSSSMTATQPWSAGSATLGSVDGDARQDPRQNVDRRDQRAPTGATAVAARHEHQQ